ncbi:AAA family ATPase [Chryseobacterium sp. MYb264]|uniref:AAA family ATPase n=1 Tax=Chryseobacterium sp. MYb264 TaxID=2745153 RepID=UPI002E10D2C4|nr:AAA family ATPase [Chryseobacterium sp. MYb264]
MELQLKNKIVNFLKLEYYSSLINSEEFYFQKAKDALDYFLNLEVTEETKTFLLTNKKEYDKLKQLFEDDGEFLVFGKAILTVISYCDSKALKKNELNQYDDKRVLALAFVRMNNWIEQLIIYKFEGRLETGSIKNAVEYLINPKDNFTMLSENHRSQLSSKLFNKNYDRVTFKNDFLNFFSQFSIVIVNPQNLTYLLTRIIYNISSEWKESLVGIMASDSTGWLSDFKMTDSYDVFWNSKKPSGTTDTIRLLKECIIENGHFKLFYTSFYNVHYIAEVIDIVESEMEYVKADWQKTFVKKSTYPNFIDLQDDNKAAKIVFLINKFYQVDPIPISQFKMFKSYSYPRQDNLTPIENYITNSQNNENLKVEKMNQLLYYKKQIILQGPPGTGKTKLAKEIASTLISSNDKLKQNLATENVIVIDEKFVKSILSIGQEIQGRNDIYEVVSIDDKGVNLKTYKTKLQGWKASFKMIIESYNKKLFENESRTGRGAYEDAVALLINNKFKNKEAKIKYKYEDFCQLIQFHPSYTYEDFVRGIVAKPDEEGEGVLYEAENKTLAKFANDALNDFHNNYVLIIDEINRANLSSVLGELIYALEYRGEEVESMYKVDGSQKLILPPNLYIIGTMNTADRSVGHIDYAIRRRFAFVDILPKELQDNDEIYFNTIDFRKVCELFNETNVSKEFEIDAVQLGHSYFIVKKEDAKDETTRDELFKMKMEYEVKPILLEYERDGILIGKYEEKSIKDYIKSL